MSEHRTYTKLRDARANAAAAKACVQHLIWTTQTNMTGALYKKTLCWYVLRHKTHAHPAITDRGWL